MFSFSQSGQDPTRPQAGKCPSVSHDRPSRECDCHSQGTGAGSPRCTPSHYPDPRMRNPPPPPPLPRHLAPHRAVTPDPARIRRWNLTGWSSRKWGRAGLIGCRRWMRIPGSSSSEKSEVSAQRRKKEEMLVCISHSELTFLLFCPLLLEDYSTGPIHYSLGEFSLCIFATQEPRII